MRQSCLVRVCTMSNVLSTCLKHPLQTRHRFSAPQWTGRSLGTLNSLTKWEGLFSALFAHLNDQSWGETGRSTA